ncbi:DUF998 domain-containing protein [Natronobeatus ordinarius]|uniref:DUF998 domain-containing protein n=1 Tax=Natronobeatus ordinarius TaxID=2963433 RepID=UPI0020CE359A|nr:DUF998 domain-containing protein [Natronobeatus ordinarius]
MSDRRRAAAGCGIAAAVITLGSIALATFLALPETFTWSERALSDMGRYGAETFWLFNGGLVAGGMIGLPFIWLLWTAARNVLERVGTALFAAGLVGMAFVGVFFLEHTEWYLETDLHVPAAALTFGSVPIAQLVLGAGAIRAGERNWGRLTVLFGLAHVVVWGGWLWYLTSIATRPMAWFAVPEFLAAALFGGWTVLRARRTLSAAESGTRSR